MILGFKGKTIDPRKLPPAFTRLTAAEIEDCLCIDKENLALGKAPTRICETKEGCTSYESRTRPVRRRQVNKRQRVRC